MNGATKPFETALKFDRKIETNRTFTFESDTKHFKLREKSNLFVLCLLLPRASFVLRVFGKLISNSFHRVYGNRHCQLDTQTHASHTCQKFEESIFIKPLSEFSQNVNLSSSTFNDWLLPSSLDHLSKWKMSPIHKSLIRDWGVWQVEWVSWIKRIYKKSDPYLDI